MLFLLHRIGNLLAYVASLLVASLHVVVNRIKLFFFKPQQHNYNKISFSKLIKTQDNLHFYELHNYTCEEKL